MSFNFSPKIARDGLILCIDPINSSCIISGQTSYRDLSKSNNNGNLVNGAIYDNVFSPNIKTNGISDYVNCNNLTKELFKKIMENLKNVLMIEVGCRGLVEGVNELEINKSLLDFCNGWLEDSRLEYISFAEVDCEDWDDKAELDLIINKYQSHSQKFDSTGKK